MNCKKGDLAVIVANDVTVQGGFCGAYIRVTELRVNKEGDPAWEYEGKRLLDRVALRLAELLGLPASEGEVVVVPDAFLRPVPPDSGSAEDLRELFAPKLPEVA